MPRPDTGTGRDAGRHYHRGSDSVSAHPEKTRPPFGPRPRPVYGRSRSDHIFTQPLRPGDSVHSRMRGGGYRLFSMLPRYLASVVRRPWQSEESMPTSAIRFERLAINRVDPMGKVDTAVQTLELIASRSTGQLRRLLLWLHPVNTPSAYWLSSDFPGHARAIWRAKYDTAIFLQGSCAISILSSPTTAKQRVPHRW